MALSKDEELELADPELAHFLDELDFDISNEHGLFSNLPEYNECDFNEGLTNLDASLFQEMKKAGFTAVDLLKEDDLARAQTLYDKLTYDHVTKDRKRIRLKDGIPRVMRNDIRWQYSQMFMNTVNSGDFKKMQGFFNTFMTKPCKFIVDHEISPEFGIPHRLLVNGPKLMAHYLLGVFVIFPDFTIMLKDSRLITSRGWVGSKIIMDVEVKSTKLYDIALDSWVPQVKYLANYKGGREWQNAGASTTNNAGTSTSTSATSTGSEPAEPTIKSEFPNPLKRDAATSGQLKDMAAQLKATIVDISGAESDAFVSAADVEISRKGRQRTKAEKEKTDEAAADTTGTATATATVTGKRKLDEEAENPSAAAAGATGAATGAGEERADGESAPRPPLPAGNPLLNPDLLLKAIFATAKLKAKPQVLRAQGTITVFLDFNNNMQHLNLRLQEDTPLTSAAASAAGSGDSGNISSALSSD